MSAINSGRIILFGAQKLNKPMSFEILLKDLGERINKLMQVKGFSKKEFMDKLEIDERTLRRILRGEAATTLNRINDIASILDVHVNMILQVSRKRILIK